MGKAPAAEPAGMELADLRKHMRIARKQPVHVAFALGADGKAVVVMDRRKPPRAIEKGLKDSAPGSKQHRFGTLEVSADDPKLARFHINKPAGGFSRKLIIALKGTGFSKVEIVTSEGVERVEGEDEDGPEDDGEDEAEEGEAAAVAVEPTPPKGDAPQDHKARAAKLTQDLHKLVKDMMDAIAQRPSQRTALTQIAIEARAALKLGDLDQAEAAIATLDDALDAGSAGSDGARNRAGEPDEDEDGDDEGDGDEDGDERQAREGGGLNATERRHVMQARRRLVDAQDEVRSQFDTFRDAVAAANDDGSFGAEVSDELDDMVQTVLRRIDDDLADTLEELAEARSAAAAEKLRRQAMTSFTRLLRFMARDTIIKDLDANPFVPLSISKTLGAALHGVDRALR